MKDVAPVHAVGKVLVAWRGYGAEGVWLMCTV